MILYILYLKYFTLQKYNSETTVFLLLRHVKASIPFSLFLIKETNISPINKHFIQRRFHWIMSKIFRFLLSTWRILDFSEWPEADASDTDQRSHKHSRSIQVSQEMTWGWHCQTFPDTNQQVTWHHTAICSWVSPLLSETQRQYLFSGALQADHMESTALFQPARLQRGGLLLPTTATLLTSYGTDVWRHKTRNETKNSSKKFCKNKKKWVYSYHNCERWMHISFILLNKENPIKQKYWFSDLISDLRN